MITELLFTTTLSTVLTIIVLFAIFLAVVQDVFWFPSIVAIVAVCVLFYARKDAMAQIDGRAVGYGALAYLPIGLGFSLFQYRRMLKRRKKDGLSTDSDGPDQHKADIAGWAIFWPFALVGNMLGFFMVDLIHNIKDWFYDMFKGMFTRIYESNK